MAGTEWGNIIYSHYLVIPPGNVGHIHIVSGGAYILVLLLSEDVKGNHVHLCVPMFAGL